MGPKEKALRAFEKRFDTRPAFIGWAPGRVNLMGEHVDYNDGFVLPAAIDRRTYIAFSPSGTTDSILLAADFNSEVHLSPRHLEAKCDRSLKSLPGWALYPAGIQWTAALHQLAVPGMQAAYSSDVPRGAGLSSSASVEIAFCKAWQMLGRWDSSDLELAQLALQAESEYVGVRCGIMDQYVSVCGRQGQAIYLDCRSLTSRYVNLPQGVSVMLADSRVRHRLADGSYNDRRAVCEEAVRELQTWLPGIRSLRDVSPEQFNTCQEQLSDKVRPVARHVIEEIERTERAVNMLEMEDLAGFGGLMVESHASLRDLYGVSCRELDNLVRIAIDLPGCYGAR